jgi:predicted house-cleaning noncanonical NTP pyrophosphatase (MazG superfamily)
MKIYNKLTRDKIPEIMEKNGKTFESRTLGDTEYREMLNKKLHEELQEFDEANGFEQIAEMADIVEVIYAIVKSKGVSIEEFENVRLAKKEDRGGFAQKLFLISVG